MARDPRKQGAYDSGMRGREQPKVKSGNTGGDRGARGPDGSTGSESKQQAGKTVGDSNGVDLSAYTSGMRGIEKPKQKSAGGDPKSRTGANKFAEQGSKEQAGNRSEPNGVRGQPSGEPSWSKDDRGPKRGVADSHVRSAASDAYDLGRNENALNSTERAAEGKQPDGEGILGEEDDTHINIRIPKASLKKKVAGMAGSV